MRKTLIVISLFFLLFLTSSCKKGEDDPAFTFLSRKARVEGNWKMTHGNLTLGYKDATGAYPDEVIEFTESSYTRKVTGTGASFEGTHTLSFQTTKKGDFVMKQSIDTLNVEFSGTWQFEGKSSDAKNKERINITLDKANNTLWTWGTFNKSLTNFKYKIKELRNKKMVLFCTEDMIGINSSYGIYVTAEYTFVQ